MTRGRVRNNPAFESGSGGKAPKNTVWGLAVHGVLVQPLKLPILQVRVLFQELPIYLGSDIRLRRRRRILRKLGSKKLVGLSRSKGEFRLAQELSNTGGRSIKRTLQRRKTLPHEAD